MAQEMADRPALVRALIRTRDEMLNRMNLPDEKFALRYAPGKWNIRQILAHLADTEMVNLWRLQRALAEPGSAVEAFDQDQWANHLRYEARPMELNQRLFQSCRAQTLYYIETVTEEQILRSIEHPEKGKVTVFRWAQITVQHAVHHLSQITAALEGNAWKPESIDSAWQYTTGVPK